MALLNQRMNVARGLARSPLKMAAPLPARVARRHISARAEAPQTPPPPPQNQPTAQVAKAAEAVGMPTEDGFFGFTPFAEVWTGRWAMLGVVSSIVVEYATGKPTLQQIGLATPSPALLAVLLAFFGTATIVASARTTSQLLGKKMSKKEINRYRNFLGLIKEEEADKTASAMKAKGDFTTPTDDLRAIAASRSQGMPADRVLGAQTERSPVAVLEREAEAGPSQSEPARQPTLAQSKAMDQEELMFSNGEARYARDVEMNNGRAAMLGFLIAVIVEAGTGQGIIGQCIGYAKLVGLLGPMSGF